MVLHAHGPLHGPVRQAPLQELDRQRPRPRLGRQEDVQAPQELPRSHPRDQQVRRGRAPHVPHQLPCRQGRAAQVPGGRRPRSRQGRIPPLVQRLQVPHAERHPLVRRGREGLRPQPRQGQRIQQLHRRLARSPHPGPHKVRPQRDEALQALHRHARARQFHHRAHELVRQVEPRSPQGGGRGRGERPPGALRHAARRHRYAGAFRAVY
mmetsp:Transcript_3744/g.7114  ORF Transcript_3744/g.7114 Transcript_3744/m.7114 type:complete len:209 (+) Transcript_3744:1339-1965(+)